MKRCFTLLGLLTVATAILIAEESTNTATSVAGTVAAVASAPDEILIKSDTLKGVYTNKLLVAVYSGNVRVTHPRWQIRADSMTCRFPTANKRPESLVLESNVTLLSLDDKGLTNNASGTRAVYSFSAHGGVTNETIVLIGTPALVDRPDSTIESERITLDLVSGSFDAGANPLIKIKSGVIGTSTNGAFNPFKQ
jgi:lipopolysaccharide transport protein LptA